MSERRSPRRKPLANRTNTITPIFSPCSSLKPKPADTPRTRTETKPSLSNSVTSTGSNDAQQLQQQHQNPSVDLPPQPNHSRASDDGDRLVFEISRPYTQLSTDGKKKWDKGKAAAASISSSCPSVGRLRSFSHEWDKVGEQGDVVPSKACLLPHINKNKVMSQAQRYRKWKRDEEQKLWNQKRKRDEEQKLWNQKRKRDEELEFDHQFQRELPHDVLEIIFSFINNWPSRIRFGAVCKAWRWVAQQYIRLKFGQPVWIMLSTYSCSGSIDFFSISDGGVTYTIHMPEACQMHCCGSSQGWLVMQKYDDHDEYLNKFILLNPLSKAIIPLPLKAKVKSSSRVEYQILPMKRIQKVILSAAPDDDCLVAAIDIHGRLYLCRTIDHCWTKQHYTKYKNFRYKDVLFYKRSIMYGIERDNAAYMVLKFMPDLNFKAKRFFVPFRFLITNYNWPKFLVECCGKVILVFGVPKDYARIQYCVCELESTQDSVYVGSFGDGVLLLDHSSCRYLPVKDCDGLNLQRNCIYVTYHPCISCHYGFSICESCYSTVYARSHWNGIFEWAGVRFRREDWRATHMSLPYVWYTPSIQI